MNFAIIGCGQIAKKHAEIISNYGTLIAVCDIDLIKAEAFSKLYNATCYSALESLLINEKELDIAVICTPNGLHAQHSIACLKANLHVICEKPMAISTVDCDKMITVSKEQNKHLFVIKQNRFNPPVVALKKAIEEKKLGEIISVQINGFWNRNEYYYLNSSWRGTKQLDGGTLFTQFSHFIDVMLYLVGDLASVHWKGMNFMHNDTISFEDTGVVTMQFKNKAIGVLHYTVNAFDQNMEGSITVFGTKGTVKIGGAYLNEISYQKIEQFNLEIEQTSSNKENDYGSYKGSMSNHDKAYENIMGVLNKNNHPIISVEEARNTVYWIEKMYDGR
jgi:predicted dehydrogenase